MYFRAQPGGRFCWLDGCVRAPDTVKHKRLLSFRNRSITTYAARSDHREGIESHRRPTGQSVNPCCPSVCVCDSPSHGPAPGSARHVHHPVLRTCPAFQRLPPQPMICVLSLVPHRQEEGSPGPPRQRGPPSRSCLFYPQTVGVLVGGGVGGLLLLLLSWRAKILRVFFSVFFSAFSVSAFAQTCEHRGTGGFQTVTRP